MQYTTQPATVYICFIFDKKRPVPERTGLSCALSECLGGIHDVLVHQDLDQVDQCQQAAQIEAERCDDLDDTLLDFHRSEAVAISETLSGFGIEPTEAVKKRYSEINRYVWQQLELGTMTREQILVRRFGKHHTISKQTAHIGFNHNLST